MKLTINQNLEIAEEEVIINCAYVDEHMQRLIDCVRQFTFSIEGELDGKIYQIPVEAIYYIESVDGKTFLYEKQQAYYSRQTLASMEQMLRHTAFVRISKNCLLNTAHLKCVEAYRNHRMRAELKNGEQLIISRNYIDSLKEKLKRR